METITYMMVDLEASSRKAAESQGSRDFLKTAAAWGLFGEDKPDNYLRLFAASGGVDDEHLQEVRARKLLVTNDFLLVVIVVRRVFAFLPLQWLK
jgi:hypothetical protein